MHQIIQLDHQLFRLINSSWQNSFFDIIMPILRNSKTWVPLYLFLLLFGIFNFKKNLWWWVLFTATLAIFCDFISSDIIKEHIFRMRPCQYPSLAIVRVSYCPHNSSFTSSHATNHFGLAMFFFLTLRNYLKKWAYLFFAWALIIVYAQVYVGVHFPLDVFCGGILGSVFGYLSARNFNKIYGLA